MALGSASMKPTEAISFPPEVTAMTQEWLDKYAPPVLKLSSHIKHKTTGVVIPWVRSFTQRGDIYDNCDAEGNTDPAAWEKTRPVGWVEARDGAPMKTPDGFSPVLDYGVIHQSTEQLSSGLPDLGAQRIDRDYRDSALPKPATDAPVRNSLEQLHAALASKWSVGDGT